eukprot:4441969-Amphidinium_carterae.1
MGITKKKEDQRCKKFTAKMKVESRNYQKDVATNNQKNAPERKESKTKAMHAYQRKDLSHRTRGSLPSNVNEQHLHKARAPHLKACEFSSTCHA